MMNIYYKIEDFYDLRRHYTIRNGYVFTSITNPVNVFDAIVIRYPELCDCHTPKVGFSDHSLYNCIDLINKCKIEKALIIAENIDFITMCPTLKHLWIIPADSSADEFDYSPLYKMSQIKSLRCSTIYGFREEFSTCIDCAKIKGLEDIHIENSGYKNYNTVTTLKSLRLSNYEKNDLTKAFNSLKLDTISIFQSKIKTLDGIQKSQAMQCLYLHYNRSLQDVSSLFMLKDTLKALRVENCPKIEDFSVLEKLENLELLELSGSNELPNLNFIKNMKKLKTFIFSMNVKDGNLSPCLGLSYVYSEKNRKHYNLKDTDLPKVEYIHGNETIDEWRRLE